MCGAWCWAAADEGDVDAGVGGSGRAGGAAVTHGRVATDTGALIGQEGTQGGGQRRARPFGFGDAPQGNHRRLQAPINVRQEGDGRGDVGLVSMRLSLPVLVTLHAGGGLFDAGSAAGLTDTQGNDKLSK